jgi:hypothetical protein
MNTENGSRLTIEAQRLAADVADGCIVSGPRSGAPRMVMPRPGGRIPRTRGRVSERAVQELKSCGRA